MNIQVFGAGRPAPQDARGWPNSCCQSMLKKWKRPQLDEWVGKKTAVNSGAVFKAVTLLNSFNSVEAVLHVHTARYIPVVGPVRQLWGLWPWPVVCQFSPEAMSLAPALWLRQWIGSIWSFRRRPAPQDARRWPDSCCQNMPKPWKKISDLSSPLLNLPRHKSFYWCYHALFDTCGGDSWKRVLPRYQIFSWLWGWGGVPTLIPVVAPEIAKYTWPWVSHVTRTFTLAFMMRSQESSRVI